MELVRFPSRGGFSVRSIFTFAFAVIITALLWATFSGNTTHAADAEWGGEAIVYENRGYTKATDTQVPSGSIPDGATLYKSQPQTNGSGSNATQKVFIIYFSPGVDPPTATNADYIEFDYKDDTLSNPQNKKAITITQQSSQPASTSCNVSGIGWLLCPLTNFLAEGMDFIFGLLAGMIETQPPVLGDTNNSLFIAWNIMRTIANIAFVIAFLIIIYSQLTSMGVSNYGLKKLIPRLIVAAVLVNISFYIAALAIDISNILGYSIQDIFNNIREEVFHLTNDDLGSGMTGAWAQVTTIILAGGGIYAGVAYMAVGGGVYMLVPLLVMLLLTIMLVLVILAARQAIIIILVIIAPLAFVANLLPNTEKWFDKWKDLFMTMLIFFPAFSLVFGGSQLAGQIIIQNAGDNIITVLFGLAVQVAPLVITPLILKLSGGLLGRIAQIANNPRKGLIDRSRNWGQARANMAKARNNAINPRRKNYNPWKLYGAATRRMDESNRLVSDKTDYWKQEADNNYHESEAYKKIHKKSYQAGQRKEAIENRHKAELLEEAAITGSDLHISTLELEGAKVRAERATAQNAHMISGYRAGEYNTENYEHLANLQRRMAENVIETAAWKQGEQAHQYIQQRKISERIEHDGNLLDIAQGYGTLELQTMGRDRARANAAATLTRLNKEARDNVVALIEDEAVEAKLSLPGYIFSQFDRVKKDPNSMTRTRLEAVLEVAANEGLVGIFEEARANLDIDQTLVDAVVARHVPDMKAKGGFHIQAKPELSLQRYLEKAQADAVAIAQKEGRSVDDVTIDTAAVERQFELDMAKARLSTLSNTNASNLGGVKFGVFQNLYKDVMQLEERGGKLEKDPSKPSLLEAIQPQADGTYSEQDQDTLMRINEVLTDAITDPSTRATLSDRLKQARAMQEQVRRKLGLEQEAEKLSTAERTKPGGGVLPESMADIDLEDFTRGSTQNPEGDSPSDNQDN